MNVDDNGDRHFRYTQSHNGLPVIGGDLIVHVDVKGAIYAVNGTARGDIAADLGASPVSQSAAIGAHRAGCAVLAASRRPARGWSTSRPTMASCTRPTRPPSPARAATTRCATRSTSISAPARSSRTTRRSTSPRTARCYTRGDGTTLPGTLKRSEGQAATTDADVNAAYDGTGDAYGRVQELLQPRLVRQRRRDADQLVHYDAELLQRVLGLGRRWCTATVTRRRAAPRWRALGRCHRARAHPRA